VQREESSQLPRGLERLDDVIVRVTTWVSLAFFASLVVVGSVSGDPQYFWESINPAAPCLAGVVMLLRRSPRALVQLVAGAAAVAVTTGLLDVGSHSGALLGLVSMGIVGTLLVRTHVVAFMASAGIGLFAVSHWWNVGGWSGRERVLEAMVPVFAFLLASGLVAWLKRELLMEGRGRREASEALAASERQFRMAFETSAATMVLLSLDDRRFLKVNGAACGMFGYTEEELLGMTAAQVTHPDDLEASTARAAAVLSGESEQFHDMVRFIRGDGSIAYGLVSAALVTSAAGAPLHFVAHAVDMTEQHDAEQQLIDLLASRDELIASVSHELRTPLTAVLGYARILLEAVPGAPPDGYELMLREIVTQGSDLVAIIEDLLVFAQSDSNSLAVDRLPIDVRDQVTLALESLKPEVAVDSVIVSGNRVEAIADPVRVRQVLRNLLTNASRYGGNSIGVDFERSDSLVRVVVSDDGEGVPQQDRERIFEPYQRAQPEDGLTAAIGVGLTVARRLARLMDGDLTYDYRDGCSRFELSLPASRVPAVARSDWDKLSV
jgi:PAS domain S-box-containing protein